MVKKKTPWYDAAGWPFWCISFAVFCGPCIYALWGVWLAEIGWFVRCSIGVFAAALLAGVFSWLVNLVVQYYWRRRRASEKRKAKKQ